MSLEIMAIKPHPSQGICILKAKRYQEIVEVRMPMKMYEELKARQGRLIGLKFNIVAGNVLVPVEG